MQHRESVVVCSIVNDLGVGYSHAQRTRFGLMRLRAILQIHALDDLEAAEWTFKPFSCRQAAHVLLRPHYHPNQAIQTFCRRGYEEAAER